MFLEHAKVNLKSLFQQILTLERLLRARGFRVRDKGKFLQLEAFSTTVYDIWANANPLFESAQIPSS